MKQGLVCWRQHKTGLKLPEVTTVLDLYNGILKKSETYYSPFAFPGASRDIGERRVHTVDVVGNITVVTQQQSRFVIPLPTAFTHRTIQTSPAFL